MSVCRCCITKTLPFAHLLLGFCSAILSGVHLLGLRVTQMDPVCCRVKDARRSSLNATGAPTVLMLCPLTKVTCLFTIGTATMTMQTGKGITKDLKGLISPVGTLSQIEAEKQSGVATFLRAGRGSRTKADELKVAVHPAILLVSSPSPWLVFTLPFFHLAN